MGKTIKYVIGIAIVVALVFGSVRIQPLDEYIAQKEDNVFDAKAVALSLVEKEIPELEALSVVDFLNQLDNDRQSLCENSGKKLGVTDVYNFLLKGDVVVTSESEESLLTSPIENSNQVIAVATDFIFGNAVRDASGLVDIGEFQNTMDFNTISVEINNWVRANPVKFLEENIKVNDTISVFGAIQVNSKNFSVNDIPVLIPIQVSQN